MCTSKGKSGFPQRNSKKKRKEKKMVGVKKKAG
jgi:hypothetical protein